MAAGKAVTLDQVSFEIVSKSVGVTEDLDNLATSLGKVRANVKGGFNSLKKLSDNLDALAKSSRNINKINKNLSGTTGIANGFKPLLDMKSPRGFSKTVKDLEKLPTVMERLDATAIENIARVSDQLSMSLTPLANKMASIAQGYNALQSMANKYGVSVTKVTEKLAGTRKRSIDVGKSLSLLKKPFTILEQSSQKLSKTFVRQFTKMQSKIKQVGLSLLGTRTLFTAVRKAVSEYMQLDQDLTKSITNTWRAMGALLAPAVEEAIYLFKQFGRVVYSIVKALTGIDLIARANEKAMAKWGSSAEDTLGSLQKFDDLNVVEFDKGSGDDNELIDMTEIDLTPIKKIMDWMFKVKQAIKEALDTGQWSNVGKVFGEGLDSAMQHVVDRLPIIEEKLRTIAKNFGDFLNAAILSVNWENAGILLTKYFTVLPNLLNDMLSQFEWGDIGQSLGGLLEGFNPADIVNSVGSLLTTIAGGLGELLINLPWDTIGSKLSDTIIAVLSNITKILESIPWGELGSKVREAIENIDWKGVWDGIVDVAETSLNSLNEFLSGLFNIPVEDIERLETAFVGISIAIATIKFAPDFLTTMSSLGSFIDDIQNLGLAFELLSKGTLSTSSISGITGIGTSLLNVFAPVVDVLTLLGGGTLGGTIAVIAGLVVVILALVEGFRQLWNESESFRNIVTELGDMIGGTFTELLDGLWTALKDGWEVLKDIYDDVLKPIFDLLVDIGKPIIEAVFELLNVLWKNVVSPLASFLKEVFLVAWDLVLVAFEAVKLAITPIISVLEWLWDKLLKPIVDWILDGLVGAIDYFTSFFKKRMENLTDGFKKIRNFLEEMIDAMKGGWKSFANFIIDKLEWLVNKIISGLNWLIRQMNKIGVTLPDWIPIIGGEKIGINIKEISEVSLPRLETGTNEVPYEGLYHLHQGEAVVPKKYNPALNNVGNEEMIERLDRVINVLENQETTTVVNIGNRKLYKEQQKYNRYQNNKYGTTVNA